MQTIERLAIDGGQPVYAGAWPSSFHGSEEFADEEKEAVLRVLDKKRVFRFLAKGIEDSEAARLEAGYREFVGRAYALAVNGGTAALITALVAAGVGPGDEVIVPAYTFIATAAAVIAARAVPVIAEIDNSLNLDPADFARKITRYTRAVIPVHMRGVPARLDEIMEVARQNNLRVIEDVAQANGGKYKGRMLGSIGDLGCFSLQQYKVITAGEGGIIVTQSEELYQRALMTHDSAIRFWKGDGGIPSFAGENYRLSELNAALALAQFQKMPAILERVRALKARVVSQIRFQPGIELQDVPDPDGDCGVALIFFCPSAEQAMRFSAALKAEGIPNGTMYDNTIADRHIYRNWDYVLAKRGATPAGCPWTCGAYHGKVEYSPDMCPRSLDYLGRAIHVGFSQRMTPEHADLIAAGIQKVARAIFA
ncbi:MAG: DegT/DnrJ/EryC1/StrS family aminotransferase [Chloroflexota bacterium]